MGLLKAIQLTTLKIDPRKQSNELPNTQKYSFAASATLTVTATTPAINNHLQVTFTTPLQGYHTWFAYQPHVVAIWTELEALQDTVLKRDPTKQSGELSEAEKFTFTTGNRLPIVTSALAANQHLQVTLAEPLKGYTTWFAYRPHVRLRREEGGQLDAARDRQRVFNDYLAIQQQEGSNMNRLSFLDRGIERSAYRDQLKQYPDRLRVAPDGQTVVSLGAALQLTGSFQTVTFTPYPNRGGVPAIDTNGLNFLHADITEACVCVGSIVNGQMRSRWLGRNPLSNVQFWSATKVVPILNVVCQANTRAATTPIGTCTIVDSRGTGNALKFADAAIDVISYRKDDIAADLLISNRIADLFKRFSSLAGLETWFRSLTGNPLQFRGYYANDPWFEWPQLRSPSEVLLSAQAEGSTGINLVSAYDLTRIMTLPAWHLFLPTTAKLTGAQWHSLSTWLECLGYDSARYIDVAIATLGIGSQIREVVILSKMGFGTSDSRDRTELTYTALVQFVDARHQSPNQPAIARTVALTLRSAVRRTTATGRRDLDEEARQIDSRMAAEVTEILRRIITQEMA